MAGYNQYSNNYMYPYGYLGYNPNQSQTNFPTSLYQPQVLTVAWVNGEEDGRNTYVSPGSSSYFMDKNLPVLYMKSVDASGHVSDFKAYDLVERVEKKPAQSTQADNNDLKNYVSELVAQAMADAGWRVKKKKEDE